MDEVETKQAIPHQASCETLVQNLLAQAELPPGPPPIVVATQIQSLPFSDLRWEDFEKLCLRLASIDHEVEDARIYGVRGQHQHGIDFYARKSTTGLYTAYQCKKVKRFRPSDLGEAVDVFLRGSWARRATTFVICSSDSFAPIALTERLELERARLEEYGIAINAWDAEALSIQLKAHPELVEEFFGPQAAVAFCVNRSPVAASNGSDECINVRVNDPHSSRTGEEDLNLPITSTVEVPESMEARAASLLPEALRAAYSIDYVMAQATTLANIADWVRSRDPDRALRLLADAERVGRSASSECDQAMTLAKIAITLRSDREQAERLIAEVKGVADHTNQHAADSMNQGTTAIAIAEAVAIIDPDQAEHLLHEIPEGSSRLVASNAVAKLLANASLGHAERIARSITDDFWKDLTLGDLVPKICTVDPDHAERIASQIGDTVSKVSALADISEYLAFTDPDRARRLIVDAERLALSIVPSSRRALAMAIVAWPLLFIDPALAEQLIADTYNLARSILNDGRWALPMIKITQTMAVVNLDRAERAAQSINDKHDRSQALAGISWAIALIDPDNAKRIASSIFDETARANALLQLMRAWDPPPRRRFTEQDDGDQD